MINHWYLFQTHDTLEHANAEPLSCDNIELLKETLDELDTAATRSRYANELRSILTNPHFKVNDWNSWTPCRDED